MRVPARGGEPPARLYILHHVADNASRLVFYHGGGWVAGNVETHEDMVRFLAQHAGAIDVYDPVVANAEELSADSNRIAVGGDSAGGDLAAVDAQQTKDAGGHRQRFNR